MYSLLNTLSEYTYSYISKTLLHALLCLFFQSSKAFSVFLRNLISEHVETKLKTFFSTAQFLMADFH